MLYGIAAYKQSGKDTVGEYLKEIYGFKIAKFAYPLKKQLSDIFKVNIKYWETDRETPQELLYGKSKREVLQWYGTDVMRNYFSKDFWLNEFIKQWGYYSLDRDVIVTDLRFPNEVEAIRQLNGKIIYLEKSDVVPTDIHESESYYSIIKSCADHIIMNDGSLSDLYKKVDSLVA